MIPLILLLDLCGFWFGRSYDFRRSTLQDLASFDLLAAWTEIFSDLYSYYFYSTYDPFGFLEPVSIAFTFCHPSLVLHTIKADTLRPVWVLRLYLSRSCLRLFLLRLRLCGCLLRRLRFPRQRLFPDPRGGGRS